MSPAGPVFAADPAVIANLVEELEQIGVVDLAAIRLVALGDAGDLHMRVTARKAADMRGEIALHDLAMIEIELQLQIRRVRPRR